MTKLIIISDSDIQSAISGRIPAIERFDDERYRILRAHLGQPQEHLTPLGIIIVSTKYGLIAPDKPIGRYRRAWSYDDVDRVLPALKPQWDTFKRQPTLREATDVMIGCLDEHLYALRRLYLAIEFVPHMEHLHYVVGGRGQQAQQISDWLQS